MKKTSPGSADSGKVLCTIEDDSGRELRKFSSGFMYKKNPQNEEYTIIPPPTVFLLFADFCGGYVPPAIVFFAAEVPRFNLGAY